MRIIMNEHQKEHMPNKSTMKGIHAVGDMGRSNCTAGLTYLKIQGILPSINPKKTAAITELTYPVRESLSACLVLTVVVKVRCLMQWRDLHR